MKQEESLAYQKRKNFFSKILTIYGRNAVKEALDDSSLKIYKLHLSSSNKNAPIIEELKKSATKREIEIAYHTKEQLSRISKNGKQDQGVALDIILEHHYRVDEFFQKCKQYRVIALDGVHNPQNLGMIIRSSVAGNIDAIILPKKGGAQITPLVIKASVGTLFKMPLIYSDNLVDTLKEFKQDNATLYTLSSYAKQSYKEVNLSEKTVFILGNETQGVSKELQRLSDDSIAIPMRRGVESLNVAVTCALLAFL